MSIPKQPTQCAVMYLRVASARHEDHGAIVRQRERCQRIAKQYGLTIVREYTDISRPARLGWQTELRRLLDDLCERRDVASVIVWNYARFGRSLDQLDEVISRIRACDAKVVTITGVETAGWFANEQPHGRCGEEV